MRASYEFVKHLKRFAIVKKLFRENININKNKQERTY